MIYASLLLQKKKEGRRKLLFMCCLLMQTYGIKGRKEDGPKEHLTHEDNAKVLANTKIMDQHIK